MTNSARTILPLPDIDNTMVDLAGGKAAGLGELITQGERVPAGFCLTTHAFRSGSIPIDAVVAAYRQLGEGRVAVRSSATAEDLPDASFAGQQDTILNVDGTDDLIGAIKTCWASLNTDRAVAYREANLGKDQAPEMAVVVQRMIQPDVAGVMFTANPITGTRDQIVVNAAPGLGTGVVDGTVSADQYVVDDATTTPGGCLSPDRLHRLATAGRRIQEHAGTPQDIEWAIDADDTLWLLQSRPITTLFPLPATDAPPPRVYFEVGHMQGMLRPFTPMGMSMLLAASSSFMGSNDHQIRAGIFGMVNIAGRMYLDLTPSVRDKSIRRRLPEALEIYGPSARSSLERVLEDPRFAPVPGRLLRPGAAVRFVLRHGPRTLAQVTHALARPVAAQNRMRRLTDRVDRSTKPEDVGATAVDHIHTAAHFQEGFLKGAMMETMGPLIGGILSRQLSAGLLKHVAAPGEMDKTQAGMPNNNTTEMDLALWEVATNVGEQRRLLLETDPEDLARLYLDGHLRVHGLDEFLHRYGRRSAAEIDVGVPRWREDPAPVFSALAGYLRASEADQTPDHRFARSAAEAEAMIATLQRRARRSPIRAGLGGFFLRRSRMLAGLRELPKFLWLHPLGEARRLLLLAGEELVDRDLLDQPDDIMFLDLGEAEALARDETDAKDLIARRRSEHERERRRRSVPPMMLSDGTIPAALAPSTPPADGSLVGLPASAGTVTGRARVILDPAGAQMAPGDILVAPTTDPGWTPLFMTAGGLVTETGSPMAHGPTVAREYGIPAVICVTDATQHIQTGDVITVDGAAGTVRVER